MREIFSTFTIGSVITSYSLANPRKGGKRDSLKEVLISETVAENLKALIVPE